MGVGVFGVASGGGVVTTRGGSELQARSCWDFERRNMNIGTQGDTSSHPTPSVADSTSPDYMDPSINEQVDDIENTDTIATDDDVQKPKRTKTSHTPKSCPVKLRADALENRESLTQSHISFPTSSVDPLSVPTFDGKFDKEMVKVDVAKWIMIHEYAFSAVEDEWCCAHIRNLVAQDGLSEIKNVIECVRDSVDYIRRSDSRLKIFTEIVKQLNLRKRKLIDDCKTRRNSTYEMLAIAIKFRDVFPRYADQDPCYLDCPSPSDWEKVVKVCSLLEVFWKATHVISRSYYPTSNLFLQEVVRVKVELDSKSQSSDDFIYDMVNSMKRKFDKYWGESNLLMARAAVLDPRYKMMAFEFFFPKLYSPEKAATKLTFVRRILYDLYSEYVSMCSAESNASGEGSTSCQSTNSDRNVEIGTLLSELASFLNEKQSVQPQKSELDMYLEENCFIKMENSKDGAGFDILDWWKIHVLKYKVLSTMARDILAIPITTVASESTFSAGSRVIDKYRARLSADSVELLMCGSDWLRKRHGLKKKSKEEKKPVPIFLPIDDDASKG
ncbi:hypothetical protein BUALT_Bualt14G0103600 [Buddleja alternifolia]|uniref:Zinc finger BED domain-containing protein RICESLEEPER 2-like n=1 Tax=Buddleja alternifolia TaxID=168488 RepID=A0AAV6WN47_9LAMI|nr:hypothetical protein BUALT_Bualt14G0103600 [Buddleja alternifolia]